MYQSITIIGNVGRDSELNYTPQGTAVAKFTVAVSKVTGKGENKTERTTWFRVTLWREKAENLSKFIRKGDKIAVTGEIDVSAYTNRDGQPQATLELTASNVVLLGSKNRENELRAPYEDDDDEFNTPGDIPF